MTVSDVIVYLALLLVVPAMFALVLRFAGAPGWSVLGGLVAGVLVGPTVLGRAVPSTYEQVFVGGVEQREALEHVVRRQGAEAFAAEQGGFGLDRLKAMGETHVRDRATLEDELRAARWDHQRPQRYITAIVVFFALLGAGVAVDRRWEPAVSRELLRRLNLHALSIGLWSAGLPGMFAVLAMTRWWGFGFAESLLAAAAVAIGPWALTRIDREIADEAEIGGSTMIRASGRLATIVALLVAAFALWTMDGARALMYAAPLIALPLTWMIPARWSAATLRETVTVALVPALAASVAVRIELHHHAALWPILILLLLSGDGRWIGGVIGAMLLGGRRALRTMRLVLGVMACGPTQLAIAAIGLSAWRMPEELGLALLLGAALIEVMTPMRRALARQLADAEAELPSR